MEWTNHSNLFSLSLSLCLSLSLALSIGLWVLQICIFCWGGALHSKVLCIQHQHLLYLCEVTHPPWITLVSTAGYIRALGPGVEAGGVLSTDNGVRRPRQIRGPKIRANVPPKGTVLTSQSLSPWCDCRRLGSTLASWRWQDINVGNPLWRQALLQYGLYI